MGKIFKPQINKDVRSSFLQRSHKIFKNRIDLNFNQRICFR